MKNYLFLTSLLSVSSSSAAVVAVTFDLGPDNVYTVADGNVGAPGFSVTPGGVGTLGGYTQGILCFGPSDGDFSGSPNTIGLFNDDAAGVNTRATPFANGTTISAATGTTGWGWLSSNFGGALEEGTFNIGFRNSLGQFGWMNITIDQGGTPNNLNNHSVAINGAFVETVVGAPITINESLIPEPSGVSLLLIGMTGLLRRRRN